VNDDLGSYLLRVQCPENIETMAKTMMDATFLRTTNELSSCYSAAMASIVAHVSPCHDVATRPG
jgi:hypothetical protein